MAKAAALQQLTESCDVVKVPNSDSWGLKEKGKGGKALGVAREPHTAEKREELRSAGVSAG
jgi:hypothetical protein